MYISPWGQRSYVIIDAIITHAHRYEVSFVAVRMGFALNMLSAGVVLFAVVVTASALVEGIVSRRSHFKVTPFANAGFTKEDLLTDMFSHLLSTLQKNTIIVRLDMTLSLCTRLML